MAVNLFRKPRQRWAVSVMRSALTALRPPERGLLTADPRKSRDI